MSKPFADFLRNRPLSLVTDGGDLRRSGKLIRVVSDVLEAAGEAIAMLHLREQVGNPEKTASDEEVLELGKNLLPLCRRQGVLLFINRRPDLAVTIGADGVQLGEKTRTPCDVRTTYPKILLGYSSHTEEEHRSLTPEVDFFFYGPVFHPVSKMSQLTEIGLCGLAHAAGGTAAPIIALGGINAQNARSCFDSGCRGVAVLGSIFLAPDPAQAAQDIIQAVTLQRKN